MFASKHSATKTRYANEPTITQFHDPEPFRYEQPPSSNDYSRTSDHGGYRTNSTAPTRSYNRIYDQNTMSARVQDQTWRYSESLGQEHDRLSRDIYNRARHEKANPAGRQGVVDQRFHLEAGTQVYLSQRGARPQSASYNRVQAPRYTGGLSYRARDDSAYQTSNRAMHTGQQVYYNDAYNRIYDPEIASEMIDFGDCRKGHPNQLGPQQTAPLAATVGRVGWQDEQQGAASSPSRSYKQQQNYPPHQSYPQQVEQGQGWQLPENWAATQGSHQESHKWTREPMGLPAAGELQPTYYKHQTERMMTNPIR